MFSIQMYIIRLVFRDFYTCRYHRNDKGWENTSGACCTHQVIASIGGLLLLRSLHEDPHLFVGEIAMWPVKQFIVHACMTAGLQLRRVTLNFVDASLKHCILSLPILS